MEKLSERLKALVESFNGVRHWSRPTVAAQSLACQVADNLPAILAALDSSEHNAKCVQFAEDVEKLVSHGLGVWFERGSYRVSIDVKDATIDILIEKSYAGPDIYMAARKAAEALVKGEA